MTEQAEFQSFSGLANNLSAFPVELEADEGVSILLEPGIGAIYNFAGGGSLRWPAEKVLELEDALTFAAFIRPVREENDPAWNSLFVVYNKGRRMNVNCDLRWNRLMCREKLTMIGDAGVALKPGVWALVVFVRAGDKVACYLNGKKVFDAVTKNVPGGFDDRIWIGSKDFGGDISHLTFFNKEFSDDDVRDLHAVCPSPLSEIQSVEDLQAHLAELKEHFDAMQAHITPIEGLQPLDVDWHLDEGIKTGMDDMYGPYVILKGASLEVPKEVLAKLDKEATFSFFYRLEDSDDKTVWRTMFSIVNEGRRENVDLAQRFNRPHVREKLAVDDSGYTMNSNAWNHIMFVRSAGKAELYIDGLPLVSRNTTLVKDGFEKSVMLGSANLDCHISHISVYDRALTLEDAARICKYQREPKDPKLYFKWAPDVFGAVAGEVCVQTHYTFEELNNFPRIKHWGKFGLPDPAKQAENFNPSLVRESAPPGVHPRVVFVESDIPDIRRRIKEDMIASKEWSLIKGRLLQATPNMADWMDINKKGYADHLKEGRIVNKRMGFHGPWVGGWINQLAEGIDPEELKGHWNENLYSCQRMFLMHLIPWEALRCLLEDDAVMGTRLAKALVTICKLYGQHMGQYGPGNTDWQGSYQYLGSDSIGLTYDWVHKFMTDEQRAVVRTFIGDVTRNKTFIGLDQVSALPCTTNWMILHMNLMTMLYSIQGEEGFDETTLKRCVLGMKKWVHLGFNHDGAPFEGLTKSSYRSKWLAPMLVNGEPLVGTEWSRNFYRKFMLGVMLPWGKDFAFECEITKPPEEVIFKYAYPDCPVIDWIYVTSNDKLFDGRKIPTWHNIRSTYPPEYWNFLFSPDPIEYKHKYNPDNSFRRLVKFCQENNEPLTYFSDYRGLMTTRSSWDPQAAFLLFETRNVPGGHTHDCRNDFVFASHGRLWGWRPNAAEGPSSRRSVILVDDEGQGHQCVQGRTVKFVDHEKATFMVGDATWAYSFRQSKYGMGRPFHLTPNMSRLEKSQLPWMDMPWGDLPSWKTGEKGGDRHSWIEDHNPVEYAYRTAGLVRATSPYAVIVDDFKKDAEAHSYKWLLQLTEDVELKSKEVIDGKVLAIHLTDKKGRNLMIAMLKSDQIESLEPAMETAMYETLDYIGYGKNPHRYDRLMVEFSGVVTLRLRTLLLPYKDGEELPALELAEDYSSVKVNWKGEETVVEFEAREGDRTLVKVTTDECVQVQ